MESLDMLAAHIASEEFASRTYRHLQSWCLLNGYPGSRDYFLYESKHNLRHMFKFQKYVDKRWEGKVPAPVDLQPVIGTKISSLTQCFTIALDLEKTILKELNDIAEQGEADEDADVERFLEHFTKVGIKLIRKYTMILERLAFAGDNAAGILHVDDEVK